MGDIIFAVISISIQNDQHYNMHEILLKQYIHVINYKSYQFDPINVKNFVSIRNFSKYSFWSLLNGIHSDPTSIAVQMTHFERIMPFD